MPRYEFTTGQVLTADQMNDLSDQTVMTFAGTAARGSAIPSPVEGMVTYRSDDDVLEVFDGSAFVGVGGGKILQVVSTTKTDTFSATVASGTPVAVTGLSATITPSSTASKILVLTSVNGSYSSTNFATVGFIVKRASTIIGAGDVVGSRVANTSVSRMQSGDGNSSAFAGSNHLDSPSTSSAVTYSVEIQNLGTGGTFTCYVNRNHLDGDNNATARSASSITLMEVAG